ncbi:MAG: prpB [Gammaproteobacteria bacterium]|jgi:methylisocitrate lyase|nr:prpB [Gammaproteobacteria bacterium]
MTRSPGKQFRTALAEAHPLQIMGTPNAYCAIMAKQIGIKSIYLSGGALAAMSYGLPDLGITTLEDVLVDVRRITDAVDTPLLVDIDTGWGSMFNIQRAIRQMTKYGAAAVHIEDQIFAKRCGHRPNKELVSKEEMVDRVTAAVSAKTDPDFFIIARTDAVASEGMSAAIERAQAYQDAGADGIFAEAVTELVDYQIFAQALDIPVLANITEFGKTALFTAEELSEVGIKMMLYPLTAARMMNQAALKCYQTVKIKGTQAELIHHMQTREELYTFLGYHAYEDALDKLRK